jgi:hypothetical protein
VHDVLRARVELKDASGLRGLLELLTDGLDVLVDDGFAHGTSHSPQALSLLPRLCALIKTSGCPDRASVKDQRSLPPSGFVAATAPLHDQRSPPAHRRACLCERGSERRPFASRSPAVELISTHNGFTRPSAAHERCMTLSLSLAYDGLTTYGQLTLALAPIEKLASKTDVSPALSFFGSLVDGAGAGAGAGAAGAAAGPADALERQLVFLEHVSAQPALLSALVLALTAETAASGGDDAPAPGTVALGGRTAATSRTRPRLVLHPQPFVRAPP